MMKKNWVIILIIFLLVANAALVSTLIISNNSDKESDNKYQKPQTQQQTKRDRSGFERHLAEKLNLNEEQRNQLKEFSSDYREIRHEYYNQIKQLKRQYFTSLTNNASEDELKILADSLGNLHVEIILMDFQHYQNIRSICTAEQARVFDSLGSERISERKYNYRHSGQGRRHQQSGDKTDRKR